MMASLGVLEIFISNGCKGCNAAKELADWVRGIKPNLKIQVIDLAITPDAGKGLVFAVPTYVHNSNIVFVGNPSPLELQKWLDNLELEG